jgi:uncharacterized YigZ family protein
MKTISGNFGPAEYKEKGSKFISFIYYIENIESVKKYLENLKKEFYDSTHICYAYRFHENGKEYYRYNDDGEPSGTAGLPILNEIKAKELFNILITVVRYYGGVKLGKGRLSRAFGTAARDVINISKITEFYIKKDLVIEIPFEFIGKTLNIIKNKRYIIIENTPLKAGIKLKISIPQEYAKPFIKNLTDISAGKITVL